VVFHSSEPKFGNSFRDATVLWRLLLSSVISVSSSSYQPHSASSGSVSPLTILALFVEWSVLGKVFLFRAGVLRPEIQIQLGVIFLYTLQAVNSASNIGWKVFQYIRKIANETRESTLTMLMKAGFWMRRFAAAARSIFSLSAVQAAMSLSIFEECLACGEQTTRKRKERTR